MTPDRIVASGRAISSGGSRRMCQSATAASSPSWDNAIAPDMRCNAMTAPHHGLYAYRPIIDRPDYDWPDGRCLARDIGVDHEVFGFSRGLGAELAPSQTNPDVMNYGWRDYGNRVDA